MTLSAVDRNYVWTAHMYDLFQNVPIPCNIPTPPYRMNTLIKDAPLAEVIVIYPSFPGKRLVNDATKKIQDVTKMISQTLFNLIPPRSQCIDPCCT